MGRDTAKAGVQLWWRERTVQARHLVDRGVCPGVHRPQEVSPQAACWGEVGWAVGSTLRVILRKHHCWILPLEKQK